MKKLLSIFATVGLISTSSLQLVSCNDNQKNKDTVENKENEQKDKDEDNNNNGNITDDTKPLTAQQIVEELKTKFETKKVAFVETLNQSIPNTVADFYKAVEDEFKADENKPAEIVIKITNKDRKKELNKETEQTNRIYVGIYEIEINISVTTINASGVSATAKSKVKPFEFIIPIKDVEVEVNKEWTHNVDLITTEMNEKADAIDFFKWEDYNLDSKVAADFYSFATVIYEIEFKGCVTKRKEEKTKKIDIDGNSEDVKIKDYELKTSKNEAVSVGVVIQLFPTSSSFIRPSFNLKTSIRATNTLQNNGEQSIIVNVKKITLHTKK